MVRTFEFAEARETVLKNVRQSRTLPASDEVALEDAAGRVLAEGIAADRDLPALDRSARDGYSVRASELPGRLKIIGEVRAGERFAGEVGAGEAVEIMTGAPVPRGADAVVMIEQTRRDGQYVEIDETAEPQQAINRRGCDALAGEAILRAGKRIDYSDVALLAAFGHGRVKVYARPTVAILATGDELVGIEETPADYQIRNSNAYSLAAQVARAGGIARVSPVVRDTLEHTRQAIVRGLEADLLLLSGGVSAGKYDLVETVLAELGAEFYFTRVAIQPGQPAVFGRAREKFFFGLPGNPVSTMVTFEIFARAAIQLLAGEDDVALHMHFARLTGELRRRSGLTRFLPATLSGDGGEVTLVNWRGSGDIPSMTRANAFLVMDADRGEYAAGDWIRVLAK
jgi:molybdopterin molybdotransferase